MRQQPNSASVAYEWIKGQLLDGLIAPGEKIAIDAIAKRFGVSRYPVMDAIKRLEVEGLLTVVPQVGCRVASYPEDEIYDFYELCREMGGKIATLAAARRTAEQVLAVETITEEIKSFSRQKMEDDVRARRFRLLNREFHLQLHDMANSRLVTNFAESMFDRLDFMISTTPFFLPYSKMLPERQYRLEAIRKAIFVRDPAAARQAYDAYFSLARLLAAPSAEQKKLKAKHR